MYKLYAILYKQLEQPQSLVIHKAPGINSSKIVRDNWIAVSGSDLYLSKNGILR